MATSLTNDDIDKLLDHASQAMKSALEKNSQRYGAIEEGDIDFKKLSQEALSRLDEFKVWENDDYKAAQAAVTQKFGLDMPLEKLAEQQNSMKDLQKKMEGLTRLAQSGVLGTPEAEAANQQNIKSTQAEIDGLEEAISDTELQISEGRALMNAKAESNPVDKKTRVAEANATLAEDKAALAAAGPGESQEQGEKKSVRFAFAAKPQSGRGSLQMGASANQAGGNSVKDSIAWKPAKPDTSNGPKFSH